MSDQCNVETVHHPCLELDRHARCICAAELADLTSRIPPHPLLTKQRREQHRLTGDELAGQVAAWTRQSNIPFAEVEPLVRTVAQQMMGAMNQLGAIWWSTGQREVADLTRELHLRLEGCRQASLALLGFADYHGHPVPKLQVDDADAVPSWDALFGDLVDWEQRIAGACQGDKAKTDWRVEDVPADMVASLPQAAAGKFVFAIAPLTLDGLAEYSGEVTYSLQEDRQLALTWQNAQGKGVVHDVDAAGCLLGSGQCDATWLPQGWSMNVYPAGWTLTHLKRWFEYAINMATDDTSNNTRSDIPPGWDISPSYAPTPRGLVTHAHLILRHLATQFAGSDAPVEPKGPTDRAGCLAQLRDVLAYIQSALGQPKPLATVAINADEPQVVLSELDLSALVMGKPKGKLTKPQFDVVKALLSAGKDGLTKDELDRRSKHGDSRKIMQRLANSDADWQQVLLLPGKTGMRYRIK